MKLISGLRAEILTLLYLNEDKEFYLREIAVKLSKTPMAVHYELNKLEKEGVIKSRYLGRMRFVSIDNKYHSKKELKSLIIKSYGVAEKIKQTLKQLPGIDEALIYGSFATGKTDNNSDIDLFVMGDLDYEELVSSVKKMESELNREINIQVMSESETKKRLKEKDPYILDIRGNKKIYLIHDEKII